jgi:hypothetical protein
MFGVKKQEKANKYLVMFLFIYLQLFAVTVQYDHHKYLVKHAAHCETQK